MRWAGTLKIRRRKHQNEFLPPSVHSPFLRNTAICPSSHLSCRIQVSLLLVLLNIFRFRFPETFDFRCLQRCARCSRVPTEQRLVRNGVCAMCVNDEEDLTTVTSFSGKYVVKARARKSFHSYDDDVATSDDNVDDEDCDYQLFGNSRKPEFARERYSPSCIMSTSTLFLFRFFGFSCRCILIWIWIQHNRWVEIWTSWVEYETDPDWTKELIRKEINASAVIIARPGKFTTRNRITRL